MKKISALIIFVALLAFGLNALAQDQDKAPAAGQRMRPAAGGPLARIKEDLKLTPEQEAKLKEFRQARQKDGQAFTEQVKKVRTEMQALRQDDKADPAKFNALIDQMFKLQSDRAKAQFKGRLDMQKIFTPDQLKKMKDARAPFTDGGLRGEFMGGPRGMGIRMGMGMGMRGGMGMGMGMRGGMGRGMMMGRPFMRFGMRMGRMMDRFTQRGGRMGLGRMGRPFGPGMGMPMHRPGVLREGVPLKEKTPEPKAPEAKK
jgi:Spy/CpxP family protein refolding chaperone